MQIHGRLLFIFRGCIKIKEINKIHDELIKKSNTVLIIDIETTGFNHDKDCIVEIGFVIINIESGKIIVSSSQIIKENHFNEKHKNAWIFNNSDLSYDDVINKGMQINRIGYQYLFDTLKVVAYNKKFDFNFLESRGLKIKYQLDCPMLLLKNIMKLKRNFGGYKYPSVEEAYRYLFNDETYKEKHRGLDDAKDEAKIIYEMFKRGYYQ